MHISIVRFPLYGGNSKGIKNNAWNPFYYTQTGLSSLIEYPDFINSMNCHSPSMTEVVGDVCQLNNSSQSQRKIYTGIFMRIVREIPAFTPKYQGPLIP